LGDEPAAEERGRAIISTLRGLGGIGKTTIARWLVWRPEVEQRFPDGRIWITLGKEPRDALTVINDCVSRLDPTLKTKATEEAASADLAALLQERSLLVIIDDVWPGKSSEVAKALMVPSPRSRYFLTTRFHFSQLADDGELRAEEFLLEDMNLAQATALIARTIGRKLSAAEEPLAQRLWEAVGGHPLALELAAARVKEGRPWTDLLGDLTAEIARLEALEETDDELIAGPDADEAREKRKSVRASLLLSVRYLSRPGQRLFAWLGIVAEDATITSRMAATLWCTEEAVARRHLRTLCSTGLLSTTDDTYRVHDLMRDLACNLLTALEVPAREGDIPGFGLTLQDASRQLLERYRAETSNGLWHTLPDDGYIHDHLVQHFEQVNWGTELESLLWEEDADRHCGWYWARERLGQTSGFIADVNRVWNYANRNVITATTHSDRAQAISLQLHCALIISSINSLSAGIPTEVLLGSVRHGLIALPTALTWVRQNPDAYFRAGALLAVAAEMPPEAQRNVLGEALSAARSVDDASSRDAALAAVASRLPPEQALVVARGIDDAPSRAEALVAVAPRLPQEAQSSALNTARGIDDAPWRAAALAAVAPLLPPEAQRSVLGEALSAARGTDDAFSRVGALVTVAPLLPPEVRQSVLGEALSTARSIDSAELRAYALAEVASRLLPEEALVAARAIDDAPSRAAALAAAALRLPPEAQPNVLGEALSAARGIDDASSRDSALAVVVSHLPPEQALLVARGIDDAWWRATALAEVASRLQPEAQLTVLDEALSAARGIDILELRAQMQAEVASRLPPEKALMAASDIDDASLRAQALAAVAPLLSPDAQLGVLDEALSTARGIHDAFWRVQALAAVAPRLPQEAQPGVLGEALSTARGIDDASSRDRALATVASHLPPEQALLVARGIDNAWWRATALAEVTSRLQPEAQLTVLGEALSAARGIDILELRAQMQAEVASQLPPEKALMAARDIDDASSRAAALAAVAPRLPPEQALLVARGIDDASSRAQALAEVAPLLPPEVRQSVLDEALSTARSIDSAELRADALAVVAPHLPPEQALLVARGIDDASSRAQVLAAVAPRLGMGQLIDFSLHLWIETVHVLAMHTRSDCVADLAAILPLIDAIGGKATIFSLGRSIISVGLWWPSLPAGSPATVLSHRA
jgi:hypothetical protein